jgi:hypothetical protein
MLVNGYTGYKTKLQHNTRGAVWCKNGRHEGIVFFSYYPTGTAREGSVVLLQATDEELGSSDSRDCAGIFFRGGIRRTKKRPHL